MDKPIRVLHVLGGLKAGGAESFVMNLYRAIDTDTVQFDFVKHNYEKGVFEEEVISSGGRIFLCPKYTGRNHISYCKWWDNFFVEHPEYHVIHGHVRSTGAIYLRIARKYGIVAISHSHSTSNGSGMTAVIKNIMQFSIRYVADYYFACSDVAGKWLYGKKIINDPKYKMIPNGIDLQRFSFNPERRKQIRGEMRIPENAVVIGHVGRFSKPKNQKFLIEIFTEFHKDNPNSYLMMVGDGDLFDDIKGQCRNLGILEKVILPGSRLDTENFYQSMDVFVFPSLWEGLGIVAIEAQANGLPCLVSDKVPKEAILCENCTCLPLEDRGMWLDTLEKIKLTERTTVLNDKLQMYDIKMISASMQSFYLEKHKREI